VPRVVPERALTRAGLSVMSTRDQHISRLMHLLHVSSRRLGIAMLVTLQPLSLHAVGPQAALAKALAFRDRAKARSGFGGRPGNA
jgi:hypothetical protein